MSNAVIIATELKLEQQAVTAALRLFDEGSTVPFIARYRKEATRGLDEVALRLIQGRQVYLLQLCERRQAVLKQIAAQGKLNDVLEKRINAAGSKGELEDLYAPYRTKRRTRALMARERGLEPLARLIWEQPAGASPATEAARFVSQDKDVPDRDAALAGARDICAERIADDARARAQTRRALIQSGRIEVQKVKAQRNTQTKFDDYASYDTRLSDVPPHRYLAICRGESEKTLKVAVKLPDERPLLGKLERFTNLDRRSPMAGELSQTIADAVGRLLVPRAVSEQRAAFKDAADDDAAKVFAENLRNLLLAAPLGSKAVLGIDPGQRTGCKCAALNATGKLLGSDTIYLVQGDKREAEAQKTLARLCKKHAIDAVAVGNGTHGRETQSFVKGALSAEGLGHIIVVSVNEAGASIYSASELAREELPNVDIVVRGAVSIARRLQDPLAELVKLDPKSIGVGQYQHDVKQTRLAAKLDEVIKDCVNHVGVQLNTASVSLLSHVAGLGSKQAQQIVSHRQTKGPFRRRKDLLAVAGLGPKTYLQAAGFLRIAGAADPLDASAVHPERYALVQRMARDVGVSVAELIGDGCSVSKIDGQRYIDGDVGSFTVEDILAELRRPGRDPRSTFEAPAFRDDVRKLDDLTEGMQLEGVVTNVTNFGAFVDVGVKQDGLVHISQLADRFIECPSDVVKVGDRLKVRVLSVDVARKRIALSARTQH